MEAICWHNIEAARYYVADIILRLMISSSTYVNLISHPVPANITKFFTITFTENEAFYTHQMMQLQIDHCLRLDHRFKLASNIGYLRVGGKWITQYSSIFIALNEKGEVVAY